MIQNVQEFITDVSAMFLTTEYKEFIATLEKKSAILKETVFKKYFQDELVFENQIYNEKAATVEKIKAYIDIQELAKDLKAGKYLIDYLEENKENGERLIKDSIGGLNSWLTMSVYTETDIMLMRAGAYFAATKFFEEKIEELKKADKDDSTLDSPKEE